MSRGELLDATDIDYFFALTYSCNRLSEEIYQYDQYGPATIENNQGFLRIIFKSNKGKVKQGIFFVILLKLLRSLCNKLSKHTF